MSDEASGGGTAVAKRSAALAAAAAVSAGSLVLAVALWWRRCRGGPLDPKERPPLARPWVPVLGSALAYKADPLGFLRRQQELLGDCFVLDLAGLVTTVVSGRREMAAVASAGDAVLSARAAVADFGFAETLGPLNVHFGTELHRFVLKGRGLSVIGGEGAEAADANDGLEEAVTSAVAAAWPGQAGCVADALAGMRRMTLHAVVLHLLGGALLEAYDRDSNDLLADFMAFQDGVEDATAKGVLMPAWFSRLFIWRPVRRERARMSRRLAAAVREAWAGGAPSGAWLQAVRHLKSREEVPAWRRALQRQPDLPASTGAVTPEEAAELVVGLLFAAHKNPAIGAAQTLLLLLEHPAALAEVRGELREGGAAEGGALRRCISEALRLTAHSLGGIRKVVAPEGFDVDAGTGRRLHVPRGEYMALSHALPNRDAGTFPDPAAFKPERFAGPRVFDEYDLTTFGQGLHRCPGRRYALKLMELLLTSVLHRYDVALLRPPPALCYERATLAQRKGSCPLQYRLRV